MAKGGARPGAGRKPKPKAEAVTDRGAAARLISCLNSIPKGEEDPEIAGWRGLWDALSPSVRLETRKYLYDKRDGKAVHTVNHLHDKPIEHTHTVSIRTTLEKARQRAMNR